MADNPLKIIGIRPEILHNLDTEQAMARVKAVYRALMREVHPDKARTPEDESRLTKEASKLSSAFGELTASGGTFESFRREYARIRPVESELAEAKGSVVELKKRTATIFESFEKYIRSIGGKGRETTVFNCAPCRLHLSNEYARARYETALTRKTDKYYEEHLKSLGEHEHSWKSTLELGKDGEMVAIKQGKRISYGDERVIVGTLRGLAMETLIELLTGTEKSGNELNFLESAGNIKQKALLISAKGFARKLVPYLSAEITPAALLISCIRPKDGELHYQVEGGITGIERLR